MFCNENMKMAGDPPPFGFNDAVGYMPWFGLPMYFPTVPIQYLEHPMDTDALRLKCLELAVMALSERAGRHCPEHGLYATQLAAEYLAWVTAGDDPATAAVPRVGTRLARDDCSKKG